MEILQCAISKLNSKRNSDLSGFKSEIAVGERERTPTIVFLRWHNAVAGPLLEWEKNLVRNTQMRQKIVRSGA